MQLLDGRFSTVSAATGAPAAGLGAVLSLDLVLLVAFAIGGTPPLKVFFYLATIGVLSLLVMYALTNVALELFGLKPHKEIRSVFPRYDEQEVIAAFEDAP